MTEETIAALASQYGIAESYVETYVSHIAAQNLSVSLIFYSIVIVCGIMFLACVYLFHISYENAERTWSKNILFGLTVLFVIAAIIVMIYGGFNLIDWIFNCENKTIISLLGTS